MLAFTAPWTLQDVDPLMQSTAYLRYLAGSPAGIRTAGRTGHCRPPLPPPRRGRKPDSGAGVGATEGRHQSTASDWSTPRGLALEGRNAGIGESYSGKACGAVALQVSKTAPRTPGDDPRAETGDDRGRGLLAAFLGRCRPRGRRGPVWGVGGLPGALATAVGDSRGTSRWGLRRGRLVGWARHDFPHKEARVGGVPERGHGLRTSRAGAVAPARPPENPPEGGSALRWVRGQDLVRVTSFVCLASTTRLPSGS
ncbi:hypothetical protein ABIC27_005130 [Streptomyces sp. PvR034]